MVYRELGYGTMVCSRREGRAMSVPALEPDQDPLPTVGNVGDPASMRPAPLARSTEEIRLSLDAIERLAGCGDRRVETLGKGGYFAARWAVGEHQEAPASGIDRPTPNFCEIAVEIETAGRAAAGAQTFPHSSWCDEGRIAQLPGRVSWAPGSCRRSGRRRPAGADLQRPPAAARILRPWSWQGYQNASQVRRPLPVRRDKIRLASSADVLGSWSAFWDIQVTIRNSRTSPSTS
jgi:hypothetical protein